MNTNKMHQRIDECADKSVGVGASLDEVAEVERALGVTLPVSYREFLSRYGWARFGFEELYGVGGDVPAHLQLVMNTSAERTTMEPTMIRSLIPILNDGAGNHYCLSTHQMSDGECPVVLWDHEQGSNQQPAQEAESFAEWLVDLLDEL